MRRAIFLLIPAVLLASCGRPAGGGTGGYQTVDYQKCTMRLTVDVTGANSLACSHATVANHFTAQDYSVVAVLANTTAPDWIPGCTSAEVYRFATTVQSRANATVKERLDSPPCPGSKDSCHETMHWYGTSNDGFLATLYICRDDDLYGVELVSGGAPVTATVDVTRQGSTQDGSPCWPNDPPAQRYSSTVQLASVLHGIGSFSPGEMLSGSNTFDAPNDAGAQATGVFSWALNPNCPPLMPRILVDGGRTSERPVGRPFQFTIDPPESCAAYWDFGDGSTSSSTAPRHSYASPGNYTVKLMVDCDTCTSEDSLDLLRGRAPERRRQLEPSGGRQPVRG